MFLVALGEAIALPDLGWFAALAAATTDSAEYTVRAELYETLYARAMRSTRVELDLNGDGHADTARRLGLLEFQRV